MNKVLVFLSAICIVLVVACSESELVGVELLNNDNIVVNFTDTLHPVVSTVEDDSIVGFATDGFNLTNFRRYVLGETNDPVFGRAVSELYLTSGIMSASLPDFDNSTFDSLIMILPLDTLPRYGDTLANHTINVHRLNAFPSSSPLISERQDTIYTDASFEYDPTPVGTVTITPRYLDSVFVFNPLVDDVVGSRPHIRIPIDAALGQEILDPTFVETDSAYQENIRGFAFTSTSGGSSSFIGLNFESFSSSSTNAIMSMFYTKDDTAKLVHNFALGTFKFSNFIHDYAGSEVEQALAGDNSKCYIQGMGGVNPTVDLSAVMQFEGKGINYAELEITVIEQEPQADFVERLPDEIVALYKNDSGNMVIVEDAVLGSTQADFEAGFGGSTVHIEENGVKKVVYRLKITNHIINLLNQEISNPILELIIRGKIETPFRSALVGNSGDSDEIKLKLVITDPQ